MADDFGLENEMNVHGSRWCGVHSGYFADPEVALPFLDAVSQEISDLSPNVVADLGGGTGFILSELAKRHPRGSIKYINVDISAKQLGQCKYDDILPLEVAATDITRSALVDSDGTLMIIMRSLLHYLGLRGVGRFLKHLRAQMKPGETMVHQTACFESSEDADCANQLYALMRTAKWYPTVSRLERTLIETGWQVVGSKPAPSLCLKSGELAERYNLTTEDTARISTEVGRKHHRLAVFVPEDSGFAAFLHYRIFTCRARQ